MANSRFDKKGIGQKVYELLKISTERIVSNDVIDEIAAMTTQHSNDLRLGKVFGYSVSEYAFAALKWINNTYSNGLYDKLIEPISDERKWRVSELVVSEPHKSI